MKRVLVTGACGFLGRHTVTLFKKKGYSVVGIGHGNWEFASPEDFGLDEWIEAEVRLEQLSSINGHLDCIVHCAGGSSVGYSVQDPLREFQRTVESTANVLEFIRTRHPQARLIYPSSAAVYGAQPDIPLRESCYPNPISPYGFYKRNAEDLCLSYSKNFDVSVSIIRFFSIYGAGLKKQLLWDACRKICSDKRAVTFYGTGDETRDWLHVSDAVDFIYFLSCSAKKGCEIFNGGSEVRTTVKEILTMLSDALQFSGEIRMGNEMKPGDPKYYWADMTKVQQLGWRPECSIKSGLLEYVAWFTAQKYLTD